MLMPIYPIAIADLGLHPNHPGWCWALSERCVRIFVLHHDPTFLFWGGSLAITTEQRNELFCNALGTLVGMVEAIVCRMDPQRCHYSLPPPTYVMSWREHSKFQRRLAAVLLNHAPISLQALPCSTRSLLSLLQASATKLLSCSEAYGSAGRKEAH